MLVAQLCPTLCDPMDYSLPGSSLHGNLQARILGWVAISFSRGFSQPRDRTQVSHFAGQFFPMWATRGQEGETVSCGMWDLVPWPGIEPRPPALGLRSLSDYTTREIPLEDNIGENLNDLGFGGDLFKTQNQKHDPWKKYLISWDSVNWILLICERQC